MLNIDFDRYGHVRGRNAVECAELIKSGPNDLPLGGGSLPGASDY